MDRHAAEHPLTRLPFQWGWWSWDLGEYRPFPVKYATYWLFPYDALPPLPDSDPEFSFLTAAEGTVSPDPALDASRERLRHKLAAILSGAETRHIRLPDTFVRFMSTPELFGPFRSGTGYWFTLSNRLVRCPGVDNGYLVCFLRDQQDCILWCLYLTPDGEHCVLAVPDDAVNALPIADVEALYGDLEEDEIEHIAAESDGERELKEDPWTSGDIRICAPSFDSFLYRFWIEDEIGWKLAGLESTPLTEMEQRYVDHYLQQHAGV